MYTLSLEKINLVKVEQHKEIVKYEQMQIVQSKFISAFMAIFMCFIFRLFLCLPPHIGMETTLA